MSNEAVLHRAMANSKVTRAFVFISSLEDSVAAVEVLQRQKRIQIFVHVADDGVEEMVASNERFFCSPSILTGGVCF